eukprot:447558-Pelagomonas_calceolata.AAC.2
MRQLFPKKHESGRKNWTSQRRHRQRASRILTCANLCAQAVLVMDLTVDSTKDPSMVCSSCHNMCQDTQICPHACHKAAEAGSNSL